MNAWDNLPNAKHIDRVLASVKANPENWEAAYYATHNAAYIAARDATYIAAGNAAWNVARLVARDASRNAAFDAASDAAYYPAWSVIAALIAYDDCAHMLESTPDELMVLHALGDERAVLFVPAAFVFNEKNITEVI